MAITTTFAESFIAGLFSGTFNLPGDTLKLALMDTSFSWDPETDVDWADISANEITPAYGYTADGMTLTGVAVTATATADDGIVNITCSNNPSWTASGGAIATTSAAVLVDHTIATPKIIMVIDFDASYATPDGQMFQVNFSGGLAQATITLPDSDGGGE